MNALLSGSRKYGTPKPDSDYDLVVRVTRADFNKLREAGEVCNPDGKEYGDGSDWEALRFGPLNLICCFTNSEFAGWVIGTNELTKAAPVERKVAVRTIDHYRNPRLWGGRMPTNASDSAKA